MHQPAGMERRSETLGPYLQGAWGVKSWLLQRKMEGKTGDQSISGLFKGDTPYIFLCTDETIDICTYLLRFSL